MLLSLHQLCSGKSSTLQNNLQKQVNANSAYSTSEIPLIRAKYFIHGKYLHLSARLKTHVHSIDYIPSPARVNTSIAIRLSIQNKPFLVTETPLVNFLRQTGA